MPRHKATCALPYEPEQLFDLAADVERYPDFLPWWVAARISQRGRDVYDTDQVVGFGMVRARFSSKTVLRRPARIDVISTDRPFRHFNLTWLFDPEPEGGCRVSLQVDLEFRSPVLEGLFGRAVGNAVGRIVSAFEARARRLHGLPATSGAARPGGPDKQDENASAN
ncbi:MAG: type II toxin-antitoxin system RatA family toxin [Kiloniellaceae bacterium]